MISKIHDITDLKQLQLVADQISSKLERPCALLLEGDLGSGKTTFVQALVKSRGGSAARSPTYALHQTYQTPEGPIDHLDLYRLQAEEELYTVGWQDILQDHSALVCVEWPQLIEKVGFSPKWKIWKLRFWHDEKSHRWLEATPSNS